MRLVLIEWIDSRLGIGWERINKMHSEPLFCWSVGWLLHDKKDAKVIVPHLAADYEDGCGEMVIPTCAIKRTIDLRYPLDDKRRTKRKTTHP